MYQQDVGEAHFHFNEYVILFLTAFRLITDSRVCSSTGSLEHIRNVECASLFYRFYNGLWSSELSNHVPETHIFAYYTRLSGRTYPFVVNWPIERTINYRK